MIAIADSSVLISLSSIGHLHILRARFEDGIIVPAAVWREVVDHGHGRPGSRRVADVEWISVKKARDGSFNQYLQTQLDEGEAEVISLAREIDADLLLLDEREARQVAEKLGISVLGTIGLLIWGTQQGLIDELKVVLDELTSDGNFHISQNLYNYALEQVSDCG